MMMDNYNLLFTLARNPRSWSPEDVQALCQKFIKDCDSANENADRLLVTKLWRYWYLMHGDQPLLAESHHNIALMLNALAFGEFVPPPSDLDSISGYRKEHSTFEDSLAPAVLPWGPAACLDPNSPILPDSPIAQARVFRQGGQIQEILLVGSPPREIQTRLFQLFFSHMLQIYSSDLEMLNMGVYRITNPAAFQKVFEIPGITSSATEPVSATAEGRSASDVLEDLAAQLLQLERQSGLVSVHEIESREKENFVESLYEYAEVAGKDRKTTIVARKPETSSALRNMLALVPYHKIAKRPIPIWITLHPGLIDTSSFLDLLSEFTYQTVERVRADAEVRKQIYEKEEQRLKAELKRWNNTPEHLRRVHWDESAALTLSFKEETGTLIRLRQVKHVPMVEYMEKHVPVLIQNNQGWAEKQTAILQDIQEATARTDSPIRRLAVSLSLDAILREREPFTDETTSKLFNVWKRQVAPFLKFQWRTWLEAEGIHPSQIFSHRTVFHTRFILDKQNNLTSLVMQPYSVMCPYQSVVVFDPQQPVVRVLGPESHAEVFKRGESQVDEAAWRSLQDAISASHAEQISERDILLKIIAKAPAVLLQSLAAEHARHEELDIPYPSPMESFQQVERQLDAHVHIANFPFQITTLIAQQAFHSVRQLIRVTGVPEALRVRLYLWLALVESEARGINLQEFDQEQSHIGIDSAKAVNEALHNARQLDPVFVQKWIERVKSQPNLQRALTMLQRDWPGIDGYLNTAEKRVVFQVRSAIQALSLSHDLDRSTGWISPSGENRATILTQIGQIVEELLLDEHGITPINDVYDLLEHLLSEEMGSSS